MRTNPTISAAKSPVSVITQALAIAAIGAGLGCYGGMSSLSGSPCESDLDCPGAAACIVTGIEGARTCQALTSDGPTQVTPQEKPTPYYCSDVKPLLDTYCNACHGAVRTASGVQNMRFDQYGDDVDGHLGAKASAQRIRIRTFDFADMPPPTFANQPTEEDRDTIARWEKAGAPECAGAGSGGGGADGGDGSGGGGEVDGGTTGGGGGGGGGGGTDAGTPTQTGPVSFAQQVQPIFNSYCIGCHATGNTKGNLNLSSGNAYKELLNVPSLCNGGVSLVSAFDSNGSMLFRKVTGDPARCNGVMPTSNALVNFDPKAAAVIEQWIKEGAKDN